MRKWCEIPEDILVQLRGEFGRREWDLIGGTFYAGSSEDCDLCGESAVGELWLDARDGFRKTVCADRVECNKRERLAIIAMDKIMREKIKFASEPYRAEDR